MGLGTMKLVESSEPVVYDKAFYVPFISSSSQSLEVAVPRAQVMHIYFTVLWFHKVCEQKIRSWNKTQHKLMIKYLGDLVVDFL